VSEKKNVKITKKKIRAAKKEKFAFCLSNPTWLGRVQKLTARSATSSNPKAEVTTSESLRELT
jgi:hypothetical protein